MLNIETQVKLSLKVEIVILEFSDNETKFHIVNKKCLYKLNNVLLIKHLVVLPCNTMTTHVNISVPPSQIESNEVGSQY